MAIVDYLVAFVVLFEGTEALLFFFLCFDLFDGLLCRFNGLFG